MAARVHLMAMGLIIITSGCLLSRRTSFGQKANASCRDIEREARKYAIAEAILVGWYER
jgi:hypothetical protein